MEETKEQNDPNRGSARNMSFNKEAPGERVTTGNDQKPHPKAPQENNAKSSIGGKY